jgi:uncharacterized protein (TIGR00375 family)
MRCILDLHIHSRFAQACSKDITVDNLEKWARIKGVDVLGTGDFTHPEWAKELDEKLVREEDGIYYTKGGMPFIYQTEISLIYTQVKGRRIHIVVLAPSRETAKRISAYFGQFGRLDYDGRPIFSIPAWKVVHDLREIDDRIEVIPAHAWTPWFSVFGSKSGFDSLNECFLKETRHIHAIETGLSSDIPMNERLSKLDNVRKVSFSDAHSYWPWRLGREATIVEIPRLTYDNVLKAIRTGEGLWGTIEVDPAYGKYHWDGHRTCNFVQSPDVTAKKGKLCPVCGKELTIGVQYRVNQLADRQEQKPGEKTKQREIKLLPLSEIISMVLGKGIATKAVWEEYWRIMKAGRNEFEVLMDVPEEKLMEVTKEQNIVRVIMQFRSGNIAIDPPGYDGVYGKPVIPGVALHMDVVKGD